MIHWLINNNYDNKNNIKTHLNKKNYRYELDNISLIYII